MSIILNDENKRVTWRLDKSNHRKIAQMAKAAGLSLEEVGNLYIASAAPETVKATVNAFRAEKKRADTRRKQATDMLSQVNPSVLERLQDMSPEDLERILSQ